MEMLDKTQLVEKKQCPICGCRSKIVDTLKTMNKESEDNVSLRECESCKHWWIDPMPKQEYLSSLYKNGSKFVVSANYNGTSPSDEDCKKMFNKVVSFREDGKFNFLEIGCGTGSLLKYFSKMANVSFGVEPGSWAAGGNIVSDINDLPKNVLFDVVILGGTLEHVVDVKSMIKKIKEITNQEAIIYVDFPNKDCIKALLMKGKWSMVLPIGHLHFFSAKSIDVLFKEFKIVLEKKLRQGGLGVFDLIKGFDLKSKGIIYRFFKSLILGQIILGKDQWEVIIKK